MVVILVDTGSSNSFINYRTAQKLGLTIASAQTLSATIANRAQLLVMEFATMLNGRYRTMYLLIH